MRTGPNYPHPPSVVADSVVAAQNSSVRTSPPSVAASHLPPPHQTAVAAAYDSTSTWTAFSVGSAASGNSLGPSDYSVAAAEFVAVAVEIVVATIVVVVVAAVAVVGVEVFVGNLVGLWMM